MAVGRQRKVKGERALRETLLNLEQQYPEALKKALIEEAFEIFEESQEQVPVDTGRLINSGVVGEMSGRVGVVIAYGTDYAIAVHERTEVPHRIGKAKFLEDPFFDAVSGMDRRLVERTRKHVRIK